MPQVSKHSCSECTKPYKPLPGQSAEEAENAMPVNMVVMDGIVMGASGELLSIYYDSVLIV